MTKDIRDALHYDPETGDFIWAEGQRGAGKLAGHIMALGYRRIRFNRKDLLAHRLAWFFVHGVMPEGDIDHINSITGDNRISNLRLATRSQNNMNKGLTKANSSGVKGVSLYSPNGKWQAVIGANGKKRHLGYYDTIKEGCHAR